MGGETMSSEDRQRYSQIIHDEAIRLTRLLDDLLDLSVLENGQVTLNERDDQLGRILDQAVSATDKRPAYWGCAGSTTKVAASSAPPPVSTVTQRGI